MSILTPLRVTGRRRAEPPGDSARAVVHEWHVGLSRAGAFPQHEVGCPCAKAPCGLAIPRADTFCATHQGVGAYPQVHSAAECAPHKWFRRSRGW